LMKLPRRPKPRPVGILIAGENPVYVDCVMARLMGYHWARIPMIYYALIHRRSRFQGPDIKEVNVTVVGKDGAPRLVEFDRLPIANFKKPRYWQRAEIPLSADRSIEKDALLEIV